MLFAEGRDLIEAVINRYEAIRKEAIKKLPQTRSVVFNTIADVIYRVGRVLEYLSELEKVVGISGDGVKKTCGNVLLIKLGNVATVMKLKPIKALTYDKVNSAVTLSDDTVRMTISRTTIKFVFRGRILEFNYTDLDEATSKAELIKAISRYVTDLANKLQICIEQCAKLHNIRL